MNKRRIRLLQAGNETNGAIIYWMSRDQRVHDNWALLFAQQLALEKKRPLSVIFNLVPDFLEATIRQYGFMVKGLKEVERELKADTKLKKEFESDLERIGLKVVGKD